MYQDVDAAVGTPVYIFWEEIHQAFPQAKIILTIRDEDAWTESMLKQIKHYDEHTWLKFMKTFSPTGWLYHYFTASHQRIVRGYDTCTWWPWKKSVPNATLMRRNYRLHNDYVARNAPKDRLLIFDISQGWEPLCKFLGKEMPTVAFPHENKNGAFHQEGFANKHPLYERMRHETIFTLSLIAAAGFIAALYFGRNNKLVLSLLQKVKCWKFVQHPVNKHLIFVSQMFQIFASFEKHAIAQYRLHDVKYEQSYLAIFSMLILVTFRMLVGARKTEFRLLSNMQKVWKLITIKSKNGSLQTWYYAIVAASGPTTWRSAYGLEPAHCSRLLVEPSFWAQTVRKFTLRSCVSRDLTVTP